ncbi:MAG: DJ-1/PfpI family protein [Acidobacteriota bacterium]|nr:DJ-1/PfpI family protein [Acidobacteriota bacterium]MDH3525114.1 DJ-1/PfpI family protein [Acidobacteriota bacterium]
MHRRFAKSPHPWAMLAAGALLGGCSAAGVRAAPAADVTAERPLTAAFLVVDGVYGTELTAPYDVLEHTRHHAADGRGIEVFTVSPDGAEIVSAEGLRIRPDHSFATAPPIDILVVPSAEGSRDALLDDAALVDWVRETGARARYVVSLCWGAFVLAEAGLLDGYACTTFPGDYERFARAFPEPDLRFNVSFVHDRGRLTSQGGARSYEVAMYLVDLLLGADVAAGVGRGLLIPWPPPPADRPAMVSDAAPRPPAR